MTINHNESFQIDPDLIWRVVDDNTVIVSPEDGDVVVLSKTGSVIWQLIVDKKAMNEIESFLVNDYIVSEEQAKVDVQVFIKELMQVGLLR